MCTSKLHLFYILKKEIKICYRLKKFRFAIFCEYFFFSQSLTKLKPWKNACITPAKRKQCLQNAGETIIHLNKLWQNASKVQFLLHNEQQTPAKRWETQAKR